MVKAYCRECGRQDELDKFEQKEAELLCCSKVTKHYTLLLGFIFNSRMENG